MPNPIALCEHCKTYFSATGIIIEESTNFRIAGSVLCPSCGNDARILEGHFDFVGDTVTFLRGPQRTVDDLRRLAEIIKEAREKGSSPEEVSDRIARESPSLSGIARLFPRTPEAFAAYLGVLASLLSPLIAESISSDAPPINIHQTIIVEQPAVGTASTSRRQSQSAQTPPPIAKLTDEELARAVRAVLDEKEARRRAATSPESTDRR